MSDWQQDAEILRLCLDVDKLPLDAESAVRGQHALDRIAAYIEELELRDNRLEAAEAETHDRILEKLLKAEKIDARHGFTLPGDSALYITLAGMEETRGDRLRAGEGDTP